jgi:hypothetical protein
MELPDSFLKTRNLLENFTYEEKLKSFEILQNHIFKKVASNEKFFIGRLSGNEPNLAGRLLSKINLNKYLMHEMLFTAGIQFTNEEDIRKYGTLYTKSVMNCTSLGIWSGNMYNQAKPFYDFVEKISSDKEYICAQALEPYYFMKEDLYRFYEIFKNKKVLIITSHSETTKHQLKKENLFQKPIFHNSTELYVYKSAQQNAGNHDSNSWEYHFNIMKNDLQNIKQNVFDFDIVLASCGGFGMILCDFLYSQLNTSVLYVGGALQLYFGIMGNRWKNNQNIVNLINEKWTNVLDIDKLDSLKINPQLCENSCYW